MCAKCKLQLGEHLINHPNNNSAHKIDISENQSVGKQCHHFQSEKTTDLIDKFPFQELNSKELIEIQNALHDDNKDADNLINSDMHKPSNEIFFKLLLNKNCGNYFKQVIFSNFLPDKQTQCQNSNFF